MGQVRKVFKVKGYVWRYPGQGGWYFMRLAEKTSNEVREISKGKAKAWGFVKIRANIKNVFWNTSLFPTKEGTYFLAFKAEIRKKLDIKEEDEVQVSFELL